MTGPEVDDPVLAAGRAKCRSVCLTIPRFGEFTSGGRTEEMFLQFQAGPQYVRLLVAPRWVRRQERVACCWRIDMSGGLP